MKDFRFYHRKAIITISLKYQILLILLQFHNLTHYSMILNSSQFLNVLKNSFKFK